MKKLLTIAILSAALAAAAQGPVLTLLDKEIDLGLIDKDTVNVGSVRLRNDGDEPLVIRSVFADCGCTVPSYPRTPIAPGDTAVIEVRFDSSGRVPGMFRKVLRINSNADVRHVFFISGKVRRPTRRD